MAEGRGASGLLYARARLAGLLRPRGEPIAALPPRETEPGISLVIPSRNGRQLLETQMPGIVRELPLQSEIIVVDNGSDDGSCEWIASVWPQVIVERSAAPLSFAQAVNRGVVRARYSHVCLLNNDMLVDAGFFDRLAHAFEAVPDLFCATAQIRFPPGVRREETGKAVMAQSSPEDFPLRCDEPVTGEDLTYVLYGSGGCSLYDGAKLRELGAIDEIYSPAYVEDLDLGYRAWQRGWPSVYVAGATVEHRHRATTRRYYSEADLDTILDRNYLKFLIRSVYSARVFRRLWTQAVRRLYLRGNTAALRDAVSIARIGTAVPEPRFAEDSFLALTDGSVAVFPGHAPRERPRRLIVNRDKPVNLAETGDFDQILIALSDSLGPPPQDVLARCIEVVLIRRSGEPEQGRRLQAASQLMTRKWRPVAQA